jgi:phosphonatase-like hydrolase
VVLDMAGTTVYDGDAVHASIGDALRVADVPVTRDEINAVMGLPKPLAIRLLLERGAADQATVREETVRRLYADFQRRMLAYYGADPAVREIEGTSAAFRTLREAGIKIALDTGFARPIADAILERLGWARSGLLDATVTSDEVANGRPHPDMIFRAMERTGVAEARRVAKVGDTPSDLQEGHAAGCGWVIGVTEGSHTREQLAQYPHTHLIRTVAALPSCLLEDRRTS